MPPTFPLFIGFIFYVGLLAISVVLSIPLLFMKSKRLLAWKIVLTILISFPSLIAVVLVFFIAFFPPALIFFWLLNEKHSTSTFGIILTIIGFLIFIALIAVCSLYLWYFLSNLLYKRLDRKPISEFLNSDKVYNYVKPQLIRLKIIAR
ncbi:hypothetical protein [Pedobacter immunditicola]|uniref:hypothetical protein n=1 Tax=Pedobacter immunditicola TaxID=3133440 RepID=UPI00309614A0